MEIPCKQLAKGKQRFKEVNRGKDKARNERTKVKEPIRNQAKGRKGVKGRF